MRFEMNLIFHISYNLRFIMLRRIHPEAFPDRRAEVARVARRQVQAHCEWCLRDLEERCGIPWFWNWCVYTAQSDGDFAGVLSAGGQRAARQLAAWNCTQLISDQPGTANRCYYERSMRKFWEARGLCDKILELYHPPFFESETGDFVYQSRKQLPPLAWMNDGVFKHGSKMYAMASIMLKGLNASRYSEGSEGIEGGGHWGCTLTDDKQGIYTFQEEDAIAKNKGFANGYGDWLHMFGDGYYWAVSYDLYVNKNKGVKPRKHKEVAFPPEAVFLWRVRLHAAPYREVPHSNYCSPIWCPALEADWK